MTGFTTPFKILNFRLNFPILFHYFSFFFLQIVIRFVFFLFPHSLSFSLCFFSAPLVTECESSVLRAFIPLLSWLCASANLGVACFYQRVTVRRTESPWDEFVRPRYPVYRLLHIRILTHKHDEFFSNRYRKKDCLTCANRDGFLFCVCESLPSFVNGDVYVI